MSFLTLWKILNEINEIFRSVFGKRIVFLGFATTNSPTRHRGRLYLEHWIEKAFGEPYRNTELTQPGVSRSGVSIQWWPLGLFLNIELRDTPAVYPATFSLSREGASLAMHHRSPLFQDLSHEDSLRSLERMTPDCFCQSNLNSRQGPSRQHGA